MDGTESELGGMLVSVLFSVFWIGTGDLLLNGSSRNLDLDLVGGPPPGNSVGGHIAFALDGRLASAAVEVGGEARVGREAVRVLGEEVVKLLFDVVLLQTIKAAYLLVSTALMKDIVSMPEWLAHAVIGGIPKRGGMSTKEARYAKRDAARRRGEVPALVWSWGGTAAAMTRQGGRHGMPFALLT